MSGPPTASERNRNNQPHDRLTDITDIGRARQQWLNDLGIYTFSDLADASVEDLANQLQEAEHSVKLDMIQQWIEQARVLAEEQGCNRWHQNRDPFTDLEGVNTAIQHWLYSLEIYTFPELAGTSAEDIESRLRAAQHTATVDEIQQWIDQCKVFINEQSGRIDRDIEQNNDIPAEKVPSVVSLEVETSDNSLEPASSETDPIDIPLEADWHSLTSFVITHQICQVSGNIEARVQIHQTETDIRQTWPIKNIEQLPSWILTRIKELSPPLSIQASSETELESKQDVPVTTPIRVEQLRFFQSPQIRYVIDAEYQAQMVGPIQEKRPFMSEVSLSFNVEGFDNSDETLNLQLRVFIANRVTGNSFSIDSSHTVLCKDTQFTFKVDLPETILEMGIYRFQLIASLTDTVGTSDLFEVPALQVI